MPEMFSKMQAKDLMHKNVVSLSVDSTLREAWEQFENARISGAPVVDGGGELVGVLSQYDIIAKLVSDESEDDTSYYFSLPGGNGIFPRGDTVRELLHTMVRDVMSPHVVTVPPETPLDSVAALMRANKIHRVIVSENKKIQGIVSTFDLLQLIENQ